MAGTWQTPGESPGVPEGGEQGQLLDGQRALPVGVDVAAEEAASGVERTDLVGDGLRSAKRFLDEGM
jgi:hypothetical protein